MSVGQHWLKGWSKEQSIIVLSSAEPEPYAAVKSTVEALDTRSMHKDVGINIDVQVMADASAAFDIFERKGVERVRHLDTNHLWIQESAAKGIVKFHKAKVTEKPVDVMTKELAAFEINKYFEMVGAKFANSSKEPSEEASDRVGEVVDRPGEARPVAQGLFIAELVGWHRHVKLANDIEDPEAGGEAVEHSRCL